MLDFKVFILSIASIIFGASSVPQGASPVENYQIFEQVRSKLQAESDNFNLIFGSENRQNISVPSRAYLVVDFDTGEILFEKNANDQMAIASITKLMTAITALDLANPNERFTVSKNAASQIPTKIGVVTGQTMTLKELLYASLLTSANDATEVIKEGIDQKYGEAVFIKAMNEKAKILGLKNTSFDNVQGLDGPNSYSTAQDVAIFTRHALASYPLIADIVKDEYKFLPQNSHHKQFDLYNWNGLLGVYPGIIGGKIGNTGKAKTTTVVVAEREGKKVLAVVLGAPTKTERDLWAANLLDVGFLKLANLAPAQVTQAQLEQKYRTWKYWN